MKTLTIILSISLFASCMAPRANTVQTGPVPQKGDTINQCKQLVVRTVIKRSNGSYQVKCLTLIK